MSNKKYNPSEIKDTHGPMNSVSKEDAKVWTSAKLGKNYDENQIKRIANAKKHKAKTSTKKHDRRMSKQILKNVDST